MEFCQQRLSALCQFSCPFCQGYIPGSTSVRWRPLLSQAAHGSQPAAHSSQLSAHCWVDFSFVFNRNLPLITQNKFLATAIHTCIHMYVCASLHATVTVLHASCIRRRCPQCPPNSICQLGTSIQASFDSATSNKRWFFNHIIVFFLFIIYEIFEYFISIITWMF